MSRFHFRNRQALAYAIGGAAVLQLGLRGVAIWLNERGGDTYDVAGASNGPLFGWLLIPESWTIDIATRFLFWLLIPLAVFLFVRAYATATSVKGVIRSPSPLAARVSVGILVISAVWLFFIGAWGLVLLTARVSPAWWPPPAVFPPILYLFIKQTWPLFLFLAVFCAFYAAHLRKRANARG